jgi:TrmH family RNA methyltransferase
MVIESKENKNIKYINKLRNTKYMNEEKKFIIEGEHLIKEAFNAGILLETYSIIDEDYGVLNNLITKDIMDYISILPSSSNVLGICKFIEDKPLGNKIIILDNVQDPGNLGTIIRSSKAFNIDTIVLSNTSVKKYNEKVIRAAQGMLFKTNVITKNIEELIGELKNNGYSVYGTDVVNGINICDVENKDKIAVIMGNEGTGITPSVKELIDKNIYIKTSDDCESLNVAVAASIIMYELNK